MWNEGEEAYLGWERKRGLLNQFNEYILGNISNPFKTNTITNLASMPPIKYIITLDADTDLVLNSAKELIGAMAHILNKPELNKSEDLVIAGHALIQPRIGIDLMSSIKSLYTKIYAGAGGVDVYANAISDIYQDNFEGDMKNEYYSHTLFYDSWKLRGDDPLLYINNYDTDEDVELIPNVTYWERCRINYFYPKNSNIRQSKLIKFLYHQSKFYKFILL